MDAAGRFQQDADQYRIDKLQHELKKQKALLKSRDNYIAQVLGVLEKTSNEYISCREEYTSCREEYLSYKKNSSAHIKQLVSQIEKNEEMWKAIRNSRTWKMTNSLNNLLIKVGLKK
jgi:septation ring formation regulator EzrA